MNYQVTATDRRAAFIRGVGRLLDFSNSINRSRHPLRTPNEDSDALRGDWKAVGSDLQRSMTQEYGRAHVRTR